MVDLAVELKKKNEDLRAALVAIERMAGELPDVSSARAALIKIRDVAGAALRPLTSATTKQRQSPWRNDPRLLLSVRAKSAIARALRQRWEDRIRNEIMRRGESPRGSDFAAYPGDETWTVDDLASLTEADLLTVHNSGYVTVREIHDALRSVGRDLSVYAIIPRGPRGCYRCAHDVYDHYPGRTSGNTLAGCEVEKCPCIQFLWERHHPLYSAWPTFVSQYGAFLQPLPEDSTR